MTEAFEVLTRLRRFENFDSSYTKTGDTIQVDDEKLFADLTEEERFNLSTTHEKYPILGIYTHSFIYVTELKVWVLMSVYNAWCAELSWNPTFIQVDEDHVLDLENSILYVKKQICEASSQT